MYETERRETSVHVLVCFLNQFSRDHGTKWLLSRKCQPSVLPAQGACKLLTWGLTDTVPETKLQQDYIINSNDQTHGRSHPCPCVVLQKQTGISCPIVFLLTLLYAIGGRLFMLFDLLRSGIWRFHKLLSSACLRPLNTFLWDPLGQKSLLSQLHVELILWSCCHMRKWVFNSIIMFVCCFRCSISCWCWPGSRNCSWSRG